MNVLNTLSDQTLVSLLFTLPLPRNTISTNFLVENVLVTCFIDYFFGTYHELCDVMWVCGCYDKPNLGLPCPLHSVDQTRFTLETRYTCTFAWVND